MLKFDAGGSRRGYCDRMTRRNALRGGGPGLVGGRALPHLLALESRAAGVRAAEGSIEPSRPRARARSCIFLFLEGGPSHIDMWDLKPDAPKEIRGPYRPIRTNVPGTFIGELMPRSAKVADKYTILRSHSHGDNGHQTGYHRVMTGYPPSFADGQANRLPTNELYPSIGSIISRQLGPGGPVPPYVNMPNPMGPGGPGFYGAEYAPFVIETDPVQADFQVRDLTPAGVGGGDGERRFRRRRQLLERVEELRSRGALTGRAGAMPTYYEKALDIVTSAQAKQAFDIHQEPQWLRESYGHTSLGQCALLGRRLVEAGCRFVGVEHGSWDTHFDNFTSLETSLAPHADQAFSALVTDLAQRGLLDETLVVLMGEMGRTPKINKDAGRDHWSAAQTVVLAGGGIKEGAVVGSTDKHASAVTSTPVSIQDLLRTIFHLMGVDADRTNLTPLGRPVPVVKDGRVVRELLA